MLYSPQWNMIDPQIDLLLSPSQHTAIYLILLAQTFLRILAMKEAPTKCSQETLRWMYIQFWLNADGWDLELNTGEWNELGSYSAYIMTTQAPNKCQLLEISKLSRS